MLETALDCAKHGATLGIVAVHKRPASVDFGRLLTTELTIVLSMGYPTEIFDVTDDIVKNWEKYALIVSDVIPFDDVQDALRLAAPRERPRRSSSRSDDLSEHPRTSD
ncbi:MDR/zinc-dependent alcohol dehydrogenase-like family protein [Catenuloplanes japonicus]|uniref:hypothetical protein n=1 Tax=Catenuloplanes japonicus TaxID=33876 RepID=UPI0012F9995B|nr:hypothetical protein [Catenuloplanes japonicus]